MSRKTFIHIILLSLILIAAGGTTVVSAAQCTAEQGQLFIDAGQYKKAVQEFSCIIDSQPTEVEGYRGRIEAELLLGRYSDAVLDYARVTALVIPVHPDAEDIILDSYTARLTIDPDNIPALTGKSFAQWWFFDYVHAVHTINHLLDLEPDNVYGNLFRGSSRLLSGTTKNQGIIDLEYALALAPQNAHVRYVIADAYTYGLPDPQRALAEASLALAAGLTTPRVHAILATAYSELGDPVLAAAHAKTHIDLVTTELVTTAPIAVDTTLNLNLVPGRTYEIPVQAIAGETISIETSSGDFWDTILVLLAPDGTPVLGSDDANFYFAAFDWTAVTTGTYRLQVTSFESVSISELLVERN